MGDKTNHDRLVESLAACRKTKFYNIPLGSMSLGKAKDDFSNVQLADVIDITPSFSRFCLAIYEIKVTRSDFLSDIRNGKWRGYLAHCHRFWFATADGVANKDDIPSEAGWIVYTEKGWKVKKPAPMRRVQIPEYTMLALVFCNSRTTVRQRHVDAVLDPEKRVRVLGKSIAEVMAKRRECSDWLINIRTAVAKMMGLPEDERLSDWQAYEWARGVIEAQQGREG